MKARVTIFSTVSTFQAGSGLVSRKILRWALLICVAVLGSLLYGASLSLALPGWQAVGSAMWLALCAGLGWCVFIPALALVSRLPARVCLDACLITMAWGEAILIGGAAGNVWLAQRHIFDPAAFNVACVALSNVTMAIVISCRMAGQGTPVWKTLALWMVALNGSGAVFFYLLRSLVETRP